MATSAIPGFTGQLFASTAAASTGAPATNAVAELQDVTLTLEMEAIPAFSKDSSGWDHSIPGKRSWSFSAKAIYHDTSGSTGQALFWDAITGRTVAGMTLRGASSSGIIMYSGGAVITQWQLGQPLDGAHVLDITGRGTDLLGRVASTS